MSGHRCQRGREIALRLALTHAGPCQGLTDPVARVALHAQRRLELAEHPGCPDGPCSSDSVPTTDRPVRVEVSRGHTGAARVPEHLWKTS